MIVASTGPLTVAWLSVLECVLEVPLLAEDAERDDAVSGTAGIAGSGSGAWKPLSLIGNRSQRAWARK
jgi:hypothetical protein